MTNKSKFFVLVGKKEGWLFIGDQLQHIESGRSKYDDYSTRKSATTFTSVVGDELNFLKR